MIRGYFLAAAVVATTYGCSTAALHPELVAKAAQVRVVREPQSVQGCAFLQPVSATEEPGYTTRSGLPVDAGTPAITMLQLRAQQAGGDTVEVTSSDRSYRAGVDRARTLATLTGNAYRCAGSPAHPEAVAPGGQVAPKSLDLATPSQVGGWQAWDRPAADGKAHATGIQVAARDGLSSLSFGCMDLAGGPVLAAAIAVSRPTKREPGSNEAATVQLRFDREAAASLPVFRAADGRTLQFYEGDVTELANLMRMHDELLARVWLEDGTTEVLEFDLRGFTGPARSFTAGCVTRQR